MAGDRNATFSVVARDAATSVLRGIGKEMGGFQKNASKAFKSVAVAAAAVGAAIGGALAATAKFAKSAISAAISDQAEQDQLIAVLKARKLATDENLASVDKLIASGQKLAFTDSQTREGISVATQYTKKFSDAQKILTTAQNVARAKHIDLAAATKLVGMAYAGNGKAAKQLGVDLTKTIGITKTKTVVDKAATEAARKEIDQINAHRKQLGLKKLSYGEQIKIQQKYVVQQKQILKGTAAVAAIDAQFQGVAQAYAETFAGSMDGVRDAINETVEAIGYAIGGGKGLPTLTKLMLGIRPVIDDIIQTINDNLPDLQKWVASFAEDIPNKVKAAWTTIKNNLPEIKATIGEWIDKAKEFVSFLITNVGPEGGIRTALAALGGKIGGKTGIIAVAFAQGLSAIGFGPLESGIAGALTGTVVSLALDVLAEMIKKKIVLALTGGAVANAATSAISSGVGAAVTTSALAPAAAALAAGLTAGLVLVIAAAITLAIGNALNWFQQQVNPNGNKGPDWIPSFGPLSSGATTTGTNNTPGSWNGWGARPMSVVNNFTFGNDAVSWMDTKLGSKAAFATSPSRLR